MELERIIEILEKHQEWRRDRNVPPKKEMQNPTEIGIAIDYAIRELKKLRLGVVMDVLPTDEEIKEMMTTSHYHYETGHYRKVRLDRIQGAKMVRDLIKKRLTGN